MNRTTCSLTVMILISSLSIFLTGCKSGSMASWGDKVSNGFGGIAHDMGFGNEFSQAQKGFKDASDMNDFVAEVKPDEMPNPQQPGTATMNASDKKVIKKLADKNIEPSTEQYVAVETAIKKKLTANNMDISDEHVAALTEQYFINQNK